MRILLASRVLLLTAVLILGLFVWPSESNPERGERDRKRSNSNSNLGLPFHHDDHLHEDDPFGHPSAVIIGSDSDSHLHSQGVCEPIKIGKIFPLKNYQCKLGHFISYSTFWIFPLKNWWTDCTKVSQISGANCKRAQEYASSFPVNLAHIESLQAIDERALKIMVSLSRVKLRVEIWDTHLSFK